MILVRLADHKQLCVFYDSPFSFGRAYGHNFIPHPFCELFDEDLCPSIVFPLVGDADDGCSSPTLDSEGAWIDIGDVDIVIRFRFPLASRQLVWMTPHDLLAMLDAQVDWI